MKITNAIVIAFTGSMFSLFASASTVNFEIDAVKNDSGKIYAQIFKGEANYQQSIAESSAVVQAQPGKVMIKFEGLPAGDYAIRFFHDENDDGKLATNLFGMPKEGFGFSNDAKPNFGPASFAQAKFTVNAADSVVTNKSTTIY